MVQYSAVMDETAELRRIREHVSFFVDAIVLWRQPAVQFHVRFDEAFTLRKWILRREINHAMEGRYDECASMFRWSVLLVLSAYTREDTFDWSGQFELVWSRSWENTKPLEHW